MKATLLICLGLVLIVTGLLLNTGRADKRKEGKLRHVVLFKFKPGVESAQIDSLIQAFSQLPHKITEIQDYEWGTDISPEKLSKGHTHCFLVTFKSEQDRDTYLTHPEHLKFVELLKPSLDDATVVDYWAR